MRQEVAIGFAAGAALGGLVDLMFGSWGVGFICGGLAGRQVGWLLAPPEIRRNLQNERSGVDCDGWSGGGDCGGGDGGD